MKIRIKGNSIRLRLSQTEVAQYCAQGRVIQRTEIPGGQFEYALIARADIREPQAEFSAGRISVFLPEASQKTWQQPDKIGFSNAVDWNNPEQLSLLVEKDFVCLDQTIEDQSDQFPNPKNPA